MLLNNYRARVGCPHVSQNLHSATCIQKCRLLPLKGDAALNDGATIIALD